MVAVKAKDGIMVSNADFAAMKGKVDRIDDEIFGNGQPGMADMVIRIDERQKTMDEKIDKLCETVNTLNETVCATKAAVDAHVSSSLHTAKGLLWNKDVALWLIAGFLILHSILPPDFTLWDLFKSLFGL